MIKTISKYSILYYYSNLNKQVAKSNIPLTEQSYKQLLEPTLQKPIIQSEQDLNYKYVKDYTQSKTKLQFDSEDNELITSKLTIDGKSITYQLNTKTTIDVKMNPLAQEALINQSLDLNDQRIAIKSSAQNEITNQNLNQVDLGQVFVMPENTIHISEVDVNNIPEDLNIQIDRTEKQLYAIGTKSNELNYQEHININNTIIEDVTLQEFKDKHLFKFEQHFVITNRKQYIKRIIRWLPWYFFLYCYLETFYEYYYAKKDIHELEIQELEQSKQFLTKQQQYLLLNSDLFRK